ncbi:MAG TPA: hypothetical protein VN957_08850 [Chthoniobacterales bacterium]|jgi:hypothetical protein|nr:hypothetical protein [Chthoniobacterales bacterium]
MDPDEKLIRRELARIRTYPRWKQSGLGGYLYYIAPDAWVEEAFRQRDGTWLVGRKRNGTNRVFTQLREALKYGESLQAPPNRNRR